MAARSEQEIRRLADKFDGKSGGQLVEDPEFQQLTVEDLQALSAEYKRRGGDARAQAAEWSDWMAAGEPGPRVLISEDADWDRPALLKLTNGKVAEVDWTVREASQLIPVALEDEVLIGGEIHPRLIEHIRANTDGD